ncbi:hypothetical protein LCM23_12870 [Cytobacillus kochii]|uniref:hypothetical protein n=1 Tax=Cytobacillus kochii TaxID=859143 RepID=UPI001CD6D018|nr:hypothetical protein [Cytobacillus kochii]MCA1026986.1 hypothetical protein [Cytobacillus kochii]
MYTLYHDKRTSVIEVKKARKALQSWNYRKEVTKHNDCYFICLTRKPLVEKADEIKLSWILELEEALNKVRQIEF